MLGLILTVVGIIIGVVGVRLTDLARKEARKPKSEASWADIDIAMRDLVARIEDKFRPDLIVSSSAGSVGIIANLYLTNTPRFVPLYVGVSRRRTPETPFTSTPVFGDRYETDRWETFLPTDLVQSGASRVLILEDAVITGDSMTKIRELLLAQGFKAEQIQTASVFVTDYAAEAGHSPDYSWRQVREQIFLFPWGKSSGKSF